MSVRKRPEAIVVGGSAGAIDALQGILPALPRSLPVPVAVVLHLLPGRPSGLDAVLREASVLAVKEAEDKEPLGAGTVYLASPNYHLLIETNRHFALSSDEPVHFSRPAIDVLFESAADAYGPALAGVLLSGANEDGARGLSRISARGGTTIVQSPESAAARQMPEAALRAGRVDYVLPIAEIGPLLRRLAEGDMATAAPATEECG